MYRLKHFLFLLSCVCAFSHAYALHTTCKRYSDDVVAAVAEAKAMTFLGYDTIAEPPDQPDKYDDSRSRLWYDFSKRDLQDVEGTSLTALRERYRRYEP
jgi:hypothetical protein